MKGCDVVRWSIVYFWRYMRRHPWKNVWNFKLMCIERHGEEVTRDTIKMFTHVCMHC